MRPPDGPLAALAGRARLSVVALAGVVWWALHQQPPQFPDTPGEWAALGSPSLLYALATLVRGERWHRLLEDEGAQPHRADSHGLNVVGYMGNNVLPARAGDAFRVVPDGPARGDEPSGRWSARWSPSALLDVAVILAIFVVVGYGLLGEVGDGSVDGSARHRRARRRRDRRRTCSCAATSACTPSSPRLASTLGCAAATACCCSPSRS